MRKWLGIALLLGLLISFFPVGAQGETKLDSINIELWSEYDQPSMLVIYEFVVSQETTLPAEIVLRFPNDSNLVAVAVKDENGKFFNTEHTPPVKQESWQIIKIKVDSYQPYHIEYYQPLTIDGNKRQFKYQWFGDYYVKGFTIATVLPGDSTELVSSPPLENIATTTTDDGLLTTGTVTKNDLKPMNSFKFELEYQRTSTDLVKSDSTEIQPLTPIDENTPGRVSITNLPWIIGGFGLALIGIALFSYWRSTQSQSNESQPRRRRQNKTEEVEEGQAYCHECGTRAQSGDRFCRTCGSRLRVE